MVRTSAPMRERLLRAAQELVEEDGYAGASVAAISARASASTGALYRHWGSKGELFAELFRHVCDREVDAMQLAAGRVATRSATDRIDAVLATFAERALRNPRLAWALIAEPVDALVEVERLAYRREYARRLADAVRAGIAAGELPEQDADLSAAAIVGGVGEALVGPLSPLSGAPDVAAIVAALRTFGRRAVGATA